MSDIQTLQSLASIISQIVIYQNTMIRRKDSLERKMKLLSHAKQIIAIKMSGMIDLQNVNH